MKRVGRAIEFLAWTLFFVLATLVLAVRFWLLPDVERYRGEIASAVSAVVGQPVKIGGIEARWYGLNPRIRLSDVRIYDRAGREALVLPGIDNRLAWRSLMQGELKIDSLAVDGLRVQVRRDPEGALHVAGIRLSGDQRFSRWLAAQDEVALRNAEIEWHDELRGAPPLVLSELNLRVRNSAQGHAIGLSAVPPPALGSTLDLRALLAPGALMDTSRWTGRLYAELGYTDLAAWRAWVDYPLAVDRGHGALRAWLTLEGGNFQEATADLALSAVSARLAPELAPLRVSAVHGRIHGGMENGRYHVAARNFTVAIEGSTAEASDFDLEWTGGAEARGKLEAAAIALQPLGPLASSLPLPERFRKLLAEARPRGRLAEVRLEWRGEPQAPSGLAARARFVDLAAAPVGALPGFAGITGSFDAAEGSARIVLATRKGELNLPQVFPQPRIALDFVNGLVEWERQPGAGFLLRIASLTFSNAHASGNVHGTYASAADGPGTIDLSAQFNRADATQLARYLPHGRLIGGEAVREWVTRSVLGGYSGDVRVRIRGDLAEFPFAEPARGEFTVSARIEHGMLDYAPGWPRIEEIDADLVFDRRSMRIAGRKGRIQGVELANVEVGIPMLGPAEPLLRVRGEAHGATSAFLGFIQSSPVRRMSGGLTDAVSASGYGKLALKLELPLKSTAHTQVEGDYQFSDNEVQVHAQLPAIERASGNVRFTQSGVSIPGVKGRLLGGGVVVSGGNQPDGSTRVQAKGEATVAATRVLFDHPWGRYLAGEFAYTANIGIAKGGGMHVVLSSPLQGVSSTLPAPLGKSAAESLPLQLELAPDERVKLRLGRLLAAELVRQRQGNALVVQRAGVALRPLADSPVRLPESTGTLVSGSLPALDLDQWLPLLGGSEPSTQTALDVRLARLDLYGKRLNEVSLRSLVQGEGWSATIASQELAGELTYRKDSGGKLVARLARFRAPEEYPGAAQRSSLDPKALPTMDFVAERFAWRGKELGRVEILGQRIGEEWRIEKLAMANPEATLSGSGAWRSGNPSRSHLDFELKAADAGQFLARVGYPDLVKGGKAELKGSLQWNGEPGSIDYPSLSGTVRLEAHSGQFLEIEPGIGKLISLMSLQSLPRRIALDFRDVFSKGFGFEDLASSGEVQAGVMTVKDFRMKGSSAQVEMSGEVDLVHETQNMKVRVVPSLGDSAATVIALVNPLLAIPAAIAQRILKDPLGHIFAFDYSVTGAWSDPKVAKLGVEARKAGTVDGNP